MKRICAFVGLLALVGCTDPIEDQLKMARSELERDQQQLDSTKSTCAYGPERSVDDIRGESLAEWDAAAGENVESISPEQEWEIRKSLGAEMGLAPSEVNGWKDIYRGRAEQAKRVLERREETRKLDDEIRATQQRAACESVAGSAKVVEMQKAEVARLEQESKDSANSPGFFTYTGYVLGALVVLAGILMAWGRWYDQRFKARVLLDGLLKQGETWFHNTPEQTQDEIRRAHQDGDVERLRQLVRSIASAEAQRHIL